jgi:translation initiation factor IF-1
MAKEELLELDGIVDEVLPDSRYRVTLDNGVVVGRVTLELSVYDLTKGRINFRHKDERATGGGGARNTQFRRR